MDHGAPRSASGLLGRGRKHPRVSRARGWAQNTWISREIDRDLGEQGLGGGVSVCVEGG